MMVATRMTDYERLSSRRSGNHAHLPSVDRTWTIGTVLAAIGSLVTVVVVVVGMIWGYAGISYATSSIPQIKETQEGLTQRVGVIEANVKNSDAKQTEILQQLYRLNDKIDRLSETKADKQLNGWVRR